MTERTPIDELPTKLMRIADGALEEPADEAVVRDAADAIVRLKMERDQWQQKWMALAQASLLVGTMRLGGGEQSAREEGKS